MLATLFFLLAIQETQGADSAPVQKSITNETAEVEKDIVYKKETTVDLSGSTVEAENQLPPAFFLSKMATPKAQGLLAERLRFSLRNYNDLGF